jgi:serine/threonine protein kinase
VTAGAAYHGRDEGQMTEGLAQVGESWAGYTILEVLGHDGMAERYRVRGEDGGIRLLDVLAIRHPQLVERLREAELERVRHPNLVAVEDVISVLRYPALVCADSLGERLSHWMKTNPTRDERLIVFHGVASGLAALHRAALPHGLLHPDAILVERHRDRPFARLGLPGVAGVVFRILREGGSITTTGASLGSTAFQSPEQLRSPARANLQSDLFALGCLLYYLLAGKSPFQGLDPLSAYEASRTETYPPLADRASDVPDDLAALVRELLRPEANLRPTADDVVGRVAPFLPAERSWAPALATLLVVVCGLAALALWMVR